MKELANFAGVWQRTKLFEPVGELGPEEEQQKDVIWIQSKNGYFIDIRYQTGATSHLKIKSFAGVGSFEFSSMKFTWDRKFDFRAPGAPDVGLMRLLTGTVDNPTQLEEDGVLPGDDYREIWDKLASASDVDCTAVLSLKAGDGSEIKNGLFLLVGGWFAITLSRAITTATVSLERELKQVFDESIEVPSAEVNSYLNDYVCVVGSTDTWTIQYALQPHLRNTSILPGQCHASLLPIFGGEGSVTGVWEWNIVDGALPAVLCK